MSRKCYQGNERDSHNGRFHKSWRSLLSCWPLLRSDLDRPVMIWGYPVGHGAFWFSCCWCFLHFFCGSWADFRDGHCLPNGLAVDHLVCSADFFWVCCGAWGVLLTSTPAFLMVTTYTSTEMNSAQSITLAILSTAIDPVTKMRRTGPIKRGASCLCECPHIVGPLWF